MNQRHSLFVEDGCAGNWTTESGEPLVFRGHESLRRLAEWLERCFPDWEWHNVRIFETEDPNHFWVECDGRGKALVPGYPQGYCENHYIHSFELENGRIKRHDLAKVGVASSSLVSRSKHDPGFGLGRREKGLRALFSFLRSAPPWCFSRFPPCSPRQAAVPPHLLARSSRRKRPLVEWPSLVERRRRSGQRFEHRQQAGEVVGHARDRP